MVSPIGQHRHSVQPLIHQRADIVSGLSKFPLTFQKLTLMVLAIIFRHVTPIIELIITVIDAGNKHVDLCIGQIVDQIV